MRRVSLFVLAVGMAWCSAGCFRGTGDPPLTAAASEPDNTVTVDGMTIRRYGARHPVAVATLEQRVAHVSVRRELERFAEAGYGLDRAASLFVEAEREDGAAVSLGILALSRLGQSETVALHLFCMEGPLGFVVVPVRVRAADGAGINAVPGARPVGAVALEVIDPLDPFPGPGPSPARWDWGRWASCVGAILAYSAASCSTHCLLTGPGFWHCFTVCVAPRLVGGIAACTFRELEGGD